MTIFQPYVPWDDIISVTACNGVLECSRLEWRVGDGGNPAAIAESFLSAHGLGLPSSADSQYANTYSYHYASQICGATLFVSAAGAAAIQGGFASASMPGPTPDQTAAPMRALVPYPTPAAMRAPMRAPMPYPTPAPTPYPTPAPMRAPIAAATPAPAVPDLAVVVFVHGAPAPVPSLSDSSATLGWLAPKSSGWRLGDWVPSWSAADHCRAVEQVREAIARGDVYQVNVVGHASAPYRGNPLPALRRVATLPGAKYGRILTGDGWALASASPEMLVSVTPTNGGELVVETRPIKGTRQATETGRRELLASAKERAEHIMIVDLERNDLAHIARIGSVDVPELFAVRRWCDLWQAESRVVARMAEGVGLADLLAAVLPGGSVTGAPKLAALAEIARLEPVGRGPAMGALGWLSERGLDLGLTIRTVAVDDDRVHVWAGGGITWDSDPAEEVAEAAAKAAPVKAALSDTVERGGQRARPRPHR